jgi:hypothetical protein
MPLPAARPASAFLAPGSPCANWYPSANDNGNQAGDFGYRAGKKRLQGSEPSIKGRTALCMGGEATLFTRLQTTGAGSMADGRQYGVVTKPAALH